MLLKDFLKPFSTSNYEVYVDNHSDYQIQLNGKTDYDEILEDFGDSIVTDVDVENDTILIWTLKDEITAG